MIRFLTNFFVEEEAATTVEYAVMLMLIVAVCIASIQLVGVNVSSIWGSNNDGIGEVLGDLDD